MQPCEYEDSVNCYWDAQTMGNGEGMSFTVDAEGNVSYVHPPTAPEPVAVASEPVMVAEVPVTPVDTSVTWQVQAAPAPVVWEQTVEPITEPAPELPEVVETTEVVAIPVTTHDVLEETGRVEGNDAGIVLTMFVVAVIVGLAPFIRKFSKKKETA